MNRTPHLVAKHRILFAAVVPFLLGLLLLFQPPLISQIIALGPLVALLGLPHGALDHRVASALWPLITLRDHAVFIAGYIGLAIAVVVLWIIAPGIALGAFLIYSALHFSDDWRAEVGLWQSLPLGISVIALPALVFQSDVTVLFGFLTAEPTATLFAALLHKAAIAAIFVSALCLVVNLRPAPWVAVEYAALVATALITSPLIYFVVYFCLLHSPRHFLLTADQLKLTLLQALRATWPILMSTLAMAAVGALVLAVLTPAFEQATLQIVFIGLAALTVPHMLLTAVFRSVHQ
ncbi:MAG: Brp/Blh family beta-carotene 15,15'-dioxygenase [Cypionkella sp.]